jgi:Spy/CpxP family protein refolding chaperone
MKNLVVVLSVLFLMTIVNQELFAQKREHRLGKDFRMDMKERLNLTDEQENKIESLRLSHEEAMIKLRADLELKELEIRKIRSSDKLSRDEMIRITKEISAIKNEMDLARVNHQMDVYDILDANQRIIWMETQDQFGHMKHRMKDRIRERMID